MGFREIVTGLLSSTPTQAPVAPSGASVPAIGKARSEYMRGGRSMTMANWRPSLRSSQSDVSQAWDMGVARATDLIQNTAWITGMVDQADANTVGGGLRFQSKPDAEALGITAAEATALGQVFERRFNAWADNPEECDVEGRRTFGIMQSAAFKSWFPTGEIWAELPFRLRPGCTYGTKVRLLPPTRILRKTSLLEKLIMGVYVDSDDRAIAYHTYRDNTYGGKDEYRVAARDRYGRPRVIHVFDGPPGTVRGITPMIGALQVSKQFDQLSDATITSWLIQTIFAASVKSEEPTEDMMAGLLSPQEQATVIGTGASPFDVWFEAQQGWYDGAPLDLGINGKIAHLFPGQEFNFHSPQGNAADFRQLAIFLLREMARCFGLTYESATGDYEGATYSSVRMATNEIFQVTLRRRKNIVRPFCQPVATAVIEEDIARGRIQVPGGYENFIKNRNAFMRADWRGSPQPQADDYKTAKKHEIYRRMGVMTDDMIAQEIGTDILSVYDGRVREREMREQRNLPEPDLDVSEEAADPLLIEDKPAGTRGGK